MSSDIVDSIRRAMAQMAEWNKEFEPPRPIMLSPENVEKLTKYCAVDYRQGDFPSFVGLPVYEIPDDDQVHEIDGYLAINKWGTVYTFPADEYRDVFAGKRFA